MKAFIAGCLAAVGIAVVAGLVLSQQGQSAAEVYQSDNVRLSEPEPASGD